MFDQVYHAPYFSPSEFSVQYNQWQIQGWFLGCLGTTRMIQDSIDIWLDTAPPFSLENMVCHEFYYKIWL